MDIPKFETQEELFEYLVQNKLMIIKQKKEAEYKKSDSIFVARLVNADKRAPQIPTDAEKLEVEVIINTTGIMDSHKDVHIPGLWKKSLKEKKDLMLLQEHKMTFENLISDKVKATAETVTWKELGFNFKGETQALTFRAMIDKEENEFMFKRYAKGAVKEHSVGMRYVNIKLAINSEDEEFKEELAVWNKYIDQVVNRKEAEENGYFWAVLEAKVIEGSAVVKGSNSFTPTRSVEATKENEAGATTSKGEPSDDTLDLYLY